VKEKAHHGNEGSNGNKEWTTVYGVFIYLSGGPGGKCVLRRGGPESYSGQGVLESSMDNYMRGGSQ